MSDTDRFCMRHRVVPLSRSFLSLMAFRLVYFVISGAMSGLLILPLQSAPPPNDQCFSAEVIPASGPFPYTSFVSAIADATTSGDPPLPPALQGLTPSRSIWYSFKPSQGGFYTLSSCRDAPTDTTVVDDVMAIY